MVFEAERSIPSILIGLILLAMGLIPILNIAGFVPFALPGFLSGVIATIFLYVIAGGGLYLIVEGFLEGIDEWYGIATLVVGLVFLVLGLINVLNVLGIVPFGIPFLGDPMVFNSIFAFEGVLLILGAFLM